ncbi:MAG: YjgN family protein [Pseudomonadota bacterium]
MTDAGSPWGRPPAAQAPAAVVAVAQPPAPTPSRPRYDGRLGELYAIYLRHLLLMVVTLGWSRFWGRTRIRRYLWNHFAVLGDRFEYRGRGIELMIGFLLVLLIVIGLGAAIYFASSFASGDKPISAFALIDTLTISLLLLGIPLAYVGHYAGLRYRLSRTRWRGIRCGLKGSAWRYGALATFLGFANGMTLQLLTPVVSVTLARPRIANTRFGTLSFMFAGNAGDIYGRYLGYYFLSILGMLAAILVASLAIGGTIEGLGLSGEELLKLVSQPSLRTVLLVVGVAVGAYLIFSLLILPLRCWWQAYLFRYLVSRSRAGDVLFATAITTRQMWGFLVVNYLIVMLTLGLGWPWVLHRTLRLIASELWIYGAPDGASVRQAGDLGPRYGEGLLDMFDVTGI